MSSEESILSPWEQHKQRQELTRAQQRPPTLQESIDRAVRQGYRVISQTESSAQLIRPKHFSAGWMLAWTIFSFGTLFWIYPIYYLSKKDEQLYLQSS